MRKGRRGRRGKKGLVAKQVTGMVLNGFKYNYNRQYSSRIVQAVSNQGYFSELLRKNDENVINNSGWVFISNKLLVGMSIAIGDLFTIVISQDSYQNGGETYAQAQSAHLTVKAAHIGSQSGSPIGKQQEPSSSATESSTSGSATGINVINANDRKSTSNTIACPSDLIAGLSQLLKSKDVGGLTIRQISKEFKQQYKYKLNEKKLSLSYEDLLHFGITFNGLFKINENLIGADTIEIKDKSVAIVAQYLSSVATKEVNPKDPEYINFIIIIHKLFGILEEQADGTSKILNVDSIPSNYTALLNFQADFQVMLRYYNCNNVDDLVGLCSRKLQNYGFELVNRANGSIGAIGDARNNLQKQQCQNLRSPDPTLPGVTGEVGDVNNYQGNPLQGVGAAASNIDAVASDV